MPRIRTIKPEFCVSEQTAECSTNARLLFVLMWCFCDDAGRHPANTKRLKMEVFPGDSFTDAEVRSFIDELIRVGLLIEYEYENTKFWEVTGWEKHQKIDRPSYKFGPLNDQGEPVFSSNARRILGESSTDATPRKGMEGNGREWRGEEGKGMDVCGVGESSPTPPATKGDPPAKPVDLPTEFSFIVCDGSEWFLSVRKYGEYRKSFPELNLDSELRKASQWTRDNAKKRKTANGMHAFLGRWLASAQDKPKPDLVGSRAGLTQEGYHMTEAQKKLANIHKAMEDFVNG